MSLPSSGLSTPTGSRRSVRCRFHDSSCCAPSGSPGSSRAAMAPMVSPACGNEVATTWLHDATTLVKRTAATQRPGRPDADRQTSFRAMTFRHSVSSAPSKMLSTRASTK